MAKDRTDPDLDRELADLPPELRWREWIRRIEAVLFASASPVPREDLARVVGQGASVDLLVEDLAADLEGRAFEIAKVAGGWIFRTRAAYAPAISRDLSGRLHARDLIGTGPRSPRRGAPYTFVTTEHFLVAFGLGSLTDLPEREQLDDAGFGIS